MCRLGKQKEVVLCEPKEISNRQIIDVDACLAPLVQMLNEYGIKTLACCCGHGKIKTSSVIISSKNVKLYSVGDDLKIHLEFPYRGEK